MCNDLKNKVVFLATMLIFAVGGMVWTIHMNM